MSIKFTKNSSSRKIGCGVIHNLHITNLVDGIIRRIWLYNFFFFWQIFNVFNYVLTRPITNSRSGQEKCFTQPQYLRTRITPDIFVSWLPWWRWWPWWLRWPPSTIRRGATKQLVCDVKLKQDSRKTIDAEGPVTWRTWRMFREGSSGLFYIYVT